MSNGNFKAMIKAAKKVLKEGGCTTKAHRIAMELCEHHNPVVKQDLAWQAVLLAR